MKFEIEITEEELQNAVVNCIAQSIARDKIPGLRGSCRYNDRAIERAVKDQFKADMRKRPDEYQRFVENAIRDSINASAKSHAGLLNKKIEEVLRQYEKESPKHG